VEENLDEGRLAAQGPPPADPEEAGAQTREGERENNVWSPGGGNVRNNVVEGEAARRRRGPCQQTRSQKAPK
jgi:hypothetical protein